jgi:hypothetical protein
VCSSDLVLIECFSGQRLFPGSDGRAAAARVGADPEIPKAVPKPWRGLLAAMIRENPVLRPSDLEVLREVRRILRKQAR